MAEPQQNKTLLVTQPGGGQVSLVVGVVLDPSSLDLEGLLAGLVPEMARGDVRAGLLVVGDSSLVLRNTGEEVLVDEIDTGELLALADLGDLEGRWDQETIVPALERWIEWMAEGWRDRLVGPLRDLLVPYVVAGLRGEVQICDGIWGQDAHRAP